MATNPRAPPPRVLRGVRNGQQARLSWIRTDRGWGVRGANAYYGAQPGWAVSVSVLPLTNLPARQEP